MNTFLAQQHPEELDNQRFPCDGCPHDDPDQRDCMECTSNGYDYEPDQFLTDVEADADALASAGWGTDEDYGFASEML